MYGVLDMWQIYRVVTLEASALTYILSVGGRWVNMHVGVLVAFNHMQVFIV